MPTKKSLQAAHQHRKELDTSSTQPQTPSEATALSSPHSDVPALEFPISPTPMEPPSDEKKFPASVAVPVQTRQSTKRKSAVTSDISDAELTRPAKKKPGPKPKVWTVDPDSEVDSSEPESKPKPSRKKPGPKPKPKAKSGPKPRSACLICSANAYRLILPPRRCRI
jgi:hypothetical protein